MTDENYTIVVHGTRDAAESIKTAVDIQPGSKSHLAERRNLDGDTAVWLLIANLGVQALPHVLDFLKEYLATKHVKRVKVGDIEIENPTVQDLEVLRRRIEKTDG